MKILHLIYTNAPAGAEKYLLHLLPSLREKGIDCHIIMISSPRFADVMKNYMERVEATGTPGKFIVASKASFVKIAYGIYRYLKTNNIKVVHAHLLNSDIIATLVKLLFYRRLVIVSTKHGYNEQRQLAYALDTDNLKRTAKKDLYFYVTQFIISKSDYNYAVSKAAALLYYNLGLIKGIMPFIHHGVTVKQLPKTSSLNKYRLSHRQIITVGRLEEIKGHRYLLEAMPILVKKYPDIKLLIIGEGCEEKKLKQMVSELQIENNVVFTGFQKDPYSYVSNSDVLILPSLFETFGLVYIEAFALRTPVVAFEAASSTEIIEDNVTGLLVKLKDSVGLAEKILFLLSDTEAAQTIAETARQKYLDHFTTERMVDETASFYRRIFKEMSKE